MRLPPLLILLPTALGATVHHLLTGAFQGTKSLHTLTFTPSTTTLNLTAALPAHAAHSWLTLSHDRANVFGVFLSTPNISTYSLSPAGVPSYTSDVPLGGGCTPPAVYTLQSPFAPYCVYATGYGGACGAVIAVDNATGALAATLQTFGYDAASGVHGAALSADGRFLYSADLRGNAVWGHSVDPASCRVATAWKVPVEKAGSGPRHTVVDPKGEWLYVLMELSNELVVYDLRGGRDVAPVQAASYSLVPDGAVNSEYWSAEVAFSASGKWMWASSRGRTGSGKEGWVNLFEIAESGGIARMVVRVPTAGTVEGYLNQLSPSPWSDEWVAMADYKPTGDGYVAMWRFDEVAETVEMVARVDVDDGGCCANVVWYD
ncbi:Lactonase, 7-bladed beta-propeller-domain-containing protein [Geopyxis carbonaria]|nr:Lactonase, 7-bladed beta-propeller-domain-containing protein [Geopyxis carbonaria]